MAQKEILHCVKSNRSANDFEKICNLENQLKLSTIPDFPIYERDSKMSHSKFLFPRNFSWGVATAAYQIEGAWNLDGKGESIWDRFTHTKGKILDGTNADLACDHYHLFKKDIRLMRELGVRNYRFSVSWPRVLPNGKGPANQQGLDFYDRLVDELLESNIEPYLTLYHWDLPQKLQDIGGWTNRDVCKYFADYSALMAKKLGDRVKYWTTLNEPWVIANLGYKTGEMAPGIQDEKTCIQVIHNLLLAHGMSVQAVRAADAKAKLGIVLILFPTHPASDSADDIRASEFAWKKESAWYLDALFKADYPADIWQHFADMAPEVHPGDMALISQELDYLGVNFYFRSVMSSGGRLEQIPGAEYTDMGWEVHAPALRHLLKKLNKDYRLPPIYITENGAAYKDELSPDGKIHDGKRLLYIRDHLLELHAAIEQGVDVQGYFLWSLMDNFEWAFGFSKRFGIVHVDYETQRRTLKDSAHWYASVIQRNGIEASDQPADEYQNLHRSTVTG